MMKALFIALIVCVVGCDLREREDPNWIIPGVKEDVGYIRKSDVIARWPEEGLEKVPMLSGNVGWASEPVQRFDASVYGDNKIYIFPNMGTIICVDQEGVEQWKHKARSIFRGGIARYRGQTLILHANYETLQFLDQNGRLADQWDNDMLKIHNFANFCIINKEVDGLDAETCLLVNSQKYKLALFNFNKTRLADYATQFPFLDVRVGIYLGRRPNSYFVLLGRLSYEGNLIVGLKAECGVLLVYNSDQELIYHEVLEDRPEVLSLWA